MNPLANAYARCSVCHGKGTQLKGAVCPCVNRRLAREREKLASPWERLWLDAKRHPEWFPPWPVPQSSFRLVEDAMYGAAGLGTVSLACEVPCEGGEEGGQ